MEVFIVIGIILVAILIIGEGSIWINKQTKGKKENANIEREKKLKADEFDKNLIRLEKLGKLYKDGIITKEEFEEKRNKFKL